MAGQLNFGLEFDAWGTGPAHFEASEHQVPCPRCKGRGDVGIVLAIACSLCGGNKTVTHCDP